MFKELCKVRYAPECSEKAKRIGKGFMGTCVPTGYGFQDFFFLKGVSISPLFLRVRVWATGQPVLPPTSCVNTVRAHFL